MFKTDEVLTFVENKIMTVESEVLIAGLIEDTKKNLNQIEKFNQLSLAELNLKKDKDSWSVLECVEHLNLYGDYYLPEIKKQIISSKNKQTTHFKSGILGNYFTNLMLPKSKLKKMKTLNDKNPIGSSLDKEVLGRFIQQQQTILELLAKARTVNLTRTKTAISISKLIKLRLGDTFRFVIAHNQRHLLQAHNVLK